MTQSAHNTIWHRIRGTRFVLGLPADIKPLRISMNAFGCGAVIPQTPPNAGFRWDWWIDSGWPVIDRRRYKRFKARIRRRS